MHKSARVLVVGTTPDYIDWIRKAAPRRAVFLTDVRMRETARESAPAANEEVLCDLSDYDESCRVLREYIQARQITLEGLTCFDCESMELTAVLAEELDLPYPSVETIHICRDKFRQKRIWQDNDVPCPQSRLIRSSVEAEDFWREIGRPCVLKPLTGSGSELVFLCHDETECREAFARIIGGLEERQTSRMYQSSCEETPLVIAEEYVRGIEFSCDFVVENGEAEIIRVARKILSSNSPFGTVRAYHISPDIIDDAIAAPDFVRLLHRAASSLGITEAICMVDFLVYDHKVTFLELTPRPGGDCIPAILRESADLDILTTMLDFAAGEPIPWRDLADFEPCIGVRIHAGCGGTLLGIQTHDLKEDPRVLAVSIYQPSGHLIQMPPKDYDSWLLGHVIFRPSPAVPPLVQCEEILGKVVVSIA